MRAAGKPAPKHWPQVDSYERMVNVIDGMRIATADAPPIFREGLSELASEFLRRHNRAPRHLTWPRLYEVLVEIAGKRADIMLNAEANDDEVVLLPWSRFDPRRSVRITLGKSSHPPHPGFWPGEGSRFRDTERGGGGRGGGFPPSR